MRLFWEVARRAFRRYSTYRSATIGGTITSTVFGLIRASVLLAVMRERRDIGGFDTADAVTFAIVSQAMLHMGLMGGHLALADRIISGDIVTDLYRPADLQLFELAQDLGRAAYQGLSRAFLTIGVGAVVFDLRVASDPGTLGLFAVSLLLANVANFAHKFLVTLTTFWTLDYRAASQMATVVGMFFSGFAVPVVFFPSWLEDFSRLLPYVGFAQIPLELLLGKLDGGELVAGLGSQIVWCGLLLAAGARCWRGRPAGWWCRVADHGLVLDKPTFRELAHIYRVMAGARIRADWQYRASFVGYTITQGLITFLDFLQIAVIFGQVDQLVGWSVAEVAFLYGASAVAFFLGDVFISQVERGPQRVRSGTFDALLTRPLGALFQLCADDFAFRRTGKLIQAVAVLVVAMTAVDVVWTPARIGVFVMMLVSGTVIFSAIWVITSSIAFWMVEGQEIMNGFTYGASFVTEYPLQVMTRWLRWLFTFVVPAAFVNFFPTLYLLGKPDPFGFPGWVRFASPGVAVVLLLVAWASWFSAVRHYRSTGS